MRAKLQVHQGMERLLSSINYPHNPSPEDPSTPNTGKHPAIDIANQAIAKIFCKS